MSNEVLKILIDNKNQYVSGSVIGQSLNISRMAVNKKINKLRNQGLNIISSTNLGYCLIDDIDLLDKDIISSLLTKNHTIEIFDTIDSTNTYLKSNINRYDFNHIIISDTQTSGRGRLDRKFYSPKNSGIYMSMLINPNCSIEQSLRLTALTSVAIYSAIKKLYNIDINIKWVNDLIIKNLKVGGILCEGDIELNKLTLNNMIIGIGINVKEMIFPKELKNIATSIENHTNSTISRNKIIATIINYFDEYFYDNTSYMDIYKRQSNTIGKEIIVHQNNMSYNAKAIDIDNDGYLIIKTEDKQIRLNSGEISIKEV